MGDGKTLISGHFHRRDYRIVVDPVGEEDWQASISVQSTPFEHLPLVSSDHDAVANAARRAVFDQIIAREEKVA